MGEYWSKYGQHRHTKLEKPNHCLNCGLLLTQISKKWERFLPADKLTLPPEKIDWSKPWLQSMWGCIDCTQHWHDFGEHRKARKHASLNFCLVCKKGTRFSVELKNFDEMERCIGMSESVKFKTSQEI